MKHITLAAVALALAACSTLGPPSITLSRSEIAERAFVDRSDADIRKVFKGMDGLGITGPDVAFQTSAQRIELAWTAKLGEGPLGIPLTLRMSLSGAPVLNARNDGIDLADARVEDVRVPSIPLLNLNDASMGRPGEGLGTLPLLLFRPDELNRDGVAYQATAVSLGTFGLRVDLAPK